MNPSRIERWIYPLLPKPLLRRVLPKLNKYKFLVETLNTQTPITFDMWYSQKVKGVNKIAYWPMDTRSKVVGVSNILCGIETNPGYSPGCYIQGLGKITIGDYTQIAANVGIISANHDLYNTNLHILSSVVIGKYCWIGMGSIILPGVVLGDFTIVGAGSVVTKSFEKGYCVIAGNPAKKIKDLEKERCFMHTSENEYNGYILASNFKNYRNKNLNI